MVSPKIDTGYEKMSSTLEVFDSHVVSQRALL